ncbi:hypothetical protein DFH09DRAFT_1188511 [Mycena vulgaris]|nr:hypothetical protein DFH09DRAFT_1188511 [Mycena vulgaris]
MLRNIRLKFELVSEDAQDPDAVCASPSGSLSRRLLLYAEQAGGPAHPYRKCRGSAAGARKRLSHSRTQNQWKAIVGMRRQRPERCQGIWRRCLLECRHGGGVRGIISGTHSDMRSHMDLTDFVNQGSWSMHFIHLRLFHDEDTPPGISGISGAARGESGWKLEQELFGGLVGVWWTPKAEEEGGFTDILRVTVLKWDSEDRQFMLSM